MRILVLSPQSPWPPDSGGAMRAWHLLYHLARHNDLHILCFAHDLFEDEKQGPLREWARVTTVYLIPPPIYDALERGDDPEAIGRACPIPLTAAYYQSEPFRELVEMHLRSGQYDLVYVITSEMGQYLPEHPAVPAAIDLWNVETLVHQRMADRTGDPADVVQAEKMQAFERDVFARCAALITVSDQETGVARCLFHHPHIVAIDNGVDTKAARPAPIPDTPHLVFTGVMEYSPNAEAILYFLQDIWPDVLAGEPSATLSVVGHKPTPEIQAAHGGPVVVTGSVPSTQPYIASARVCIVPLLSGGGTRLKILEAFAAGRPVVSTSLGAEGLAVEDGVHLLIADTPAEFARATLRVLDDRSLAERLGAAGRRLVEERYDWRVLAARLEAAFESLIPAAAVS